ncbi:MAG: magnesium transporter [Acidimicrobiia bacterium]|nr:magnesium transporter [Acidimicrobiia bacterium]
MKLHLRRPRDLALALRDLARRRPHEAADYLDTHEEEWTALAGADPHDAADILEAIGEESAADLIADLTPGEAADVLEEMHDEAAADVLEELHLSEAAAAVSELAPEEAADIVGHLEDDTREAIFGAMEGGQVRDIRDLLRYPPDSAGGLMMPDHATLAAGITAGEAIEALRRLHEGLENVNYVYVVEHDGRLAGVVSFRELVFARPLTALDEVMVRHPVSVHPEADREEVSELIQRYDLLALPVVDGAGVLLGIVTIDDVMEAMQREASEDIAAMVGAGVEETLYTPFHRSVLHRLPWTAVNLATALAVAFVVSRFEPIISEIAVLAAYMPVVASVGGNSGAQSQAVIIRAMATDAVPSGQVRRVLGRSLLIGLVNGFAVGLLSGAIAGGFTHSAEIGFVIGLAAQVNLIVANLAGSGIPILLHRLGQDPAMASNIFMTMITDMVGFGGFLAIATVLL